MTAAYDSDFTDRLIFGEKRCPTCGEMKPRNSEHFHRDESESGRLHRECRVCRLQGRQSLRGAE